MPVLLFATRNPWKGQQFQPVFAAHGFTMRTLVDLSNLRGQTGADSQLLPPQSREDVQGLGGFGGCGTSPKSPQPSLQEQIAAPEDEPTPLLNALQKARRYHTPAFPWVFADDAGLEIDALNGEPGLQARRWGGIFPDNVDDQTWLDYLLERMGHVPSGQRHARFISGWALITPTGQEFTHSTEWPFEIALEPVRPLYPGSPISAVRIGPEDDLARRQVEISTEFRRWGILERLSQQGSIERQIRT